MEVHNCNPAGCRICIPVVDLDRYRQALETIQWWEYEVDECDGLLREARDLLYHMPAHRPSEGTTGNCPGCDLERRIDEHLVEGHQAVLIDGSQIPGRAAKPLDPTISAPPGRGTLNDGDADG
jgi:hypothetical protein